jgi:hypothetical protein
MSRDMIPVNILAAFLSLRNERMGKKRKGIQPATNQAGRKSSHLSMVVVLCVYMVRVARLANERAVEFAT